MHPPGSCAQLLGHHEPSTLQRGHGPHSAPLNPGALHKTPLKARTGDAQSLWHLVIYPQRPASAVAAEGEGNRLTTPCCQHHLGITRPHSEGGKGNPELREERGWKKYLLQGAQTVGRSKDAALQRAGRHKQRGHKSFISDPKTKKLAKVTA